MMRWLLWSPSTYRALAITTPIFFAVLSLLLYLIGGKWGDALTYAACGTVGSALFAVLRIRNPNVGR